MKNCARLRIDPFRFVGSRWQRHFDLRFRAVNVDRVRLSRLGEHAHAGYGLLGLQSNEIKTLDETLQDGQLTAQLWTPSSRRAVRQWNRTPIRSIRGE